MLAREDSTLEALSARLAALESGAPGGRPNAAVPVPAKPVLASERAGHARPASRPETPAAPTAQDEASNSGPLPSVQKVRAAWEKIRSRAESERPSLRAPLSNAAVEMVDGRAIVLRMRDKVSGDILREHAKLLEAAVADVLGAPLRITCKVDAAKPGARSTSKSGAPAGEDPDELFAYANERIQKR